MLTYRLANWREIINTANLRPERHMDFVSKWLIITRAAVFSMTLTSGVIGGAAGAFPPLVGWAAVTGSLSLLALALFAVVFFWTPPHFWSLALLLRRQYSAVHVPMLPVVAGDRTTRQAIVAYTVVLLAVSAVPSIWLGPVYGVAALALGGVMLWMAIRVAFTEGVTWAARLFHFSLAYLALLFGMAAVAAVLPR